MEVLNTLTSAIKTSASVIKWGVGLQESTRRDLVSDLQTICANCESAYDAVLERLVPVKNTFADPEILANELRAFAADNVTRGKFKPQHLCSQIDDLLMRLSSNLDPLKYSVDFMRIKELQASLSMVGTLDIFLLKTYDEFANNLTGLRRIFRVRLMTSKNIPSMRNTCYLNLKTI